MTHTGAPNQDAAQHAESTSRFYDEQASEYFERTVHASLEHLYERFLPGARRFGDHVLEGIGRGSAAAIAE